MRIAMLAMCLAFSARAAYASFRPLFRQEDFDKPSNNLADCRPSVRQAIEQAKAKWGDFQLTCVEGVIRRLHVTTDSKIDSSIGQFLPEQRALFGIEKGSMTVTMEGNHGTFSLKSRKGHIIRHFIREQPRGGSGPGGTLAARDLLKAPGVKGPFDGKKPFIVIEVVFPPLLDKSGSK